MIRTTFLWIEGQIQTFSPSERPEPGQMFVVMTPDLTTSSPPQPRRSLPTSSGSLLGDSTSQWWPRPAESTNNEDKSSWSWWITFSSIEILRFTSCSLFLRICEEDDLLSRYLSVNLSINYRLQIAEYSIWWHNFFKSLS